MVRLNKQHEEHMHARFPVQQPIILFCLLLILVDLVVASYIAWWQWQSHILQLRECSSCISLEIMIFTPKCSTMIMNSLSFEMCTTKPIDRWMAFIWVYFLYEFTLISRNKGYLKIGPWICYPCFFTTVKFNHLKFCLSL